MKTPRRSYFRKTAKGIQLVVPAKQTLEKTKRKKNEESKTKEDKSE